MIRDSRGTLREIAYPTTELVQAVDRGDELKWVPADAVADGDRPVGEPVPARVLSPVGDSRCG